MDIFLNFEGVIGSYFDANLIGSQSVNKLSGQNGNDIISGHGASDTLIGGAAEDILDGGLGSDVMIGGVGDDTYYVDSQQDSIYETASEGNNVVLVSCDFVLISEQMERVVISGIASVGLTANNRSNVIIGNVGDNIIYGLLGNDRIESGGVNDRIDAGTGNDIVVGGAGRDIMTGGDGIDSFIFKFASDSLFLIYDNIGDLEDHDVVDLSAIDANSLIVGNQAFTLASALSGAAGQLAVSYSIDNDFTLMIADSDGDGAADFRLLVHGNHVAHDNVIF